MGWTWDGETIPMKQVGRMIGLGLLLLAGLVIMLNDRTEPVVGAARAEQTAADGQLALGQAALTVTKVASPAIAGVGQMITYTYVVENLSTALITDVQALDDPLGVVPLGVTELAAGEVVTGVRTYTVSEDDLPGPLTNTVAVSGVVDGETPVQASAIATVTLISSPALAIAKSVSPAVAAPGVTLTYSYHLTNTGDVTLDSLIAEDDRLGPLALAATTLSPDQAITHVVAYLVSQADMPGPLVNTVVASAIPPAGPPVSASASATVTLVGPALTVVKHVAPQQAEAGDVVTYTYTISNSGDVLLTNLTAFDDRLGAITLPSATLAPDESTSAQRVYTVAMDDLPGPLVNTVTVTATPLVGPPISATASASLLLDSTPALTVTKTVQPNRASVNDTITYTYRLANIGNVLIEGLSITDEHVGVITLTQTTLAPGEVMTATAIHVVDEADVPNLLTSRVTAEGVAIGGDVVSAEAEATVELYGRWRSQPIIIPDRTEARVGDTIVFNYRVRNNGNVTLYSVTGFDELIGEISLSPTQLAPGERALAWRAYEVQEQDLSGPLINTFIVTATTAWGHTFTNVLTAATELLSSPALTVVVAASAAQVEVGEPIIYTYEVTNIGDVTLTSVTVSDDRLGAIVLSQTVLAPGASASGQAAYTPADADRPGPLVNSVVAIGQPPAGNAVAASASVAVSLEAAAPPSFTSHLPLIRK